MSTGSTFTTPLILTATAGLIAFHIGVLTLVGRERKSPYVINLIFPIFVLSLIVAIFAVGAELLPSAWQSALLTISGWLFIAALVLSVAQVYRIIARFVFFVDTVGPKQWPGIRSSRRWLDGKRGKTYSHTTIEFPPALRADLDAIVGRTEGSRWTATASTEPKSLAIAADHQAQANELLGKLALAFLRKGFAVQYTAASRHPIQFLTHLKSVVENDGIDWLTVARLIVAVDAYSPHFAFTDSIYAKKDQHLLVDFHVSLIRSRMTYAGIHTAASRAFQTIKDATKGEQQGYRAPALVIYDGAYALTDLESPEQYRIFLRHVLPSEDMWGGMFTVFVECAQPQADWKILGSYVTTLVDLRVADSATHEPVAPKPRTGRRSSGERPGTQTRAEP